MSGIKQSGPHFRDDMKMRNALIHLLHLASDSGEDRGINQILLLNFPALTETVIEACQHVVLFYCVLVVWVTQP